MKKFVNPFCPNNPNWQPGRFIAPIDRSINGAHHHHSRFLNKIFFDVQIQISFFVDSENASKIFSFGIQLSENEAFWPSGVLKMHPQFSVLAYSYAKMKHFALPVWAKRIQNFQFWHTVKRKWSILPIRGGQNASRIFSFGIQLNENEAFCPSGVFTMHSKFSVLAYSYAKMKHFAHPKWSKSIQNIQFWQKVKRKWSIFVCLWSHHSSIRPLGGFGFILIILLVLSSGLYLHSLQFYWSFIIRSRLFFSTENKSNHPK